MECNIYEEIKIKLIAIFSKDLDSQEKKIPLKFKGQIGTFLFFLFFCFCKARRKLQNF